MKKSGQQSKINLLLDNSDKYDWGVVKVSPSILLPTSEIQMQDIEICGTWGKMSDGTLWLHLESTLEALHDKATLILAELSERRRKGLSIGPILKPERSESSGQTPRPRRTRESRPQQAPEEDQSSVISKEMQVLREKLHTKA
jgi:hypothetical protein